MDKFIEVVKHCDGLNAAINIHSIESITEFIRKDFTKDTELLVQIRTLNGSTLDTETTYEEILQQLKEED